MKMRLIAVAALAACSVVAVPTNEQSEKSNKEVQASPGAEVVGRLNVPDGAPFEWVFDVPGDMTEAVGIEFDFWAEELEGFDQFKVSFKSGKGAYVAAFDPGKEGQWNHVVLKKSDAYRNAGQVEGWRSVRTFAILGQRNRQSSKPIRLANIRMATRARPEIVVVRGDAADNVSRNNHHDYKTCAASKLLERMDAPVVQMSDFDLAFGIPPSVKLLVFPANPRVDTNAVGVVGEFAVRGGRFLVSSGVDEWVRRQAGFSCKKHYDRRKDLGKSPLTGLVRVGPGLAGQPERVRGMASFIIEPVVRSGAVEPLAMYSDAEGKNTGIVALARVPRGFCYSGTWPMGGADSRALMRAVLLTVEPAWRSRLEDSERVAQEADQAERKWLASLKPRPGEARSICCHNPKGVPGHDLDDVIGRLKAGGFNAFDPNVAWAGEYSREDAAKWVETCRRHGVDCCLWKVCWRLHGTAVAPGRMQRDFSGKVFDGWLCPADPANRAAELKIFLDMASLGPKAVDLDYIRYDSGFNCACDGCRAEMERRLGHPIKNWRKDVWENPDAKEKWMDYRRETITSFVREVSRRVREEYPSVKVYADVIPALDTAKGWFGQDWELWAREGIVDSVRPMNYYAGNTAGFAAALRYQFKRLKGSKATICPTLGLSEWPDFGDDARRMAEEILAVREIGCQGFGVFQIGERAFGVFPALRTGPTAE